MTGHRERPTPEPCAHTMHRGGEAQWQGQLLQVSTYVGTKAESVSVCALGLFHWLQTTLRACTVTVSLRVWLPLYSVSFLNLDIVTYSDLHTQCQIQYLPLGGSWEFKSSLLSSQYTPSSPYFIHNQSDFSLDLSVPKATSHEWTSKCFAKIETMANQFWREADTCKSNSVLQWFEWVLELVISQVHVECRVNELYLTGCCKHQMR